MSNVLQTGEVKWVPLLAGELIQAEEGTLWLTFEGLPEDIILKGGQSWRAPRNGRALLQALRTATYRGLRSGRKTKQGDAHFMPRSLLNRSLIGSRG